MKDNSAIPRQGDLEAFDQQLREQNQNLKAASIRVRIERERGCRTLGLRGTFPPKPWSDRTQPHRQRLRLGLRATQADLRRAIEVAKRVDVDLACGRFQWSTYGYEDPSPKIETFGDWARQFERDYFQRRARSRKTESTYKTEFAAVFRRLPLDEPLDASVALELVLSVKPDTRQRKRIATVLQKLMDLAGQDVDLRQYQGNYTPGSVQPQTLPRDEEIVAWRDRIANDRWRYLYSLVAIYGLRPSEAMSCTVNEGSAIATVGDGKTGARQCLPLHPEWFRRWGIACGQLPDISGQHNRDIGSRIYKAFRRYEIPFNPYALRHAFARRALEAGLSTAIAAQTMGHHPDVHQRIYLRWLQADTFERIYREMVERRSAS